MTDWSSTSSYSVLPIAVPTVTSPSNRTGRRGRRPALGPGAGRQVVRAPGRRRQRLPDAGDRLDPPEGLRHTYSPKVTFPNDQFFWRVRAVDLANQVTAWQTPEYGPDDHPPVRPDLARHPAGDPPRGGRTQQVGDDLYYEWSPVQHASHYEVWLSTDENFTEPTRPRRSSAPSPGRRTRRANPATTACRRPRAPCTTGGSGRWTGPTPRSACRASSRRRRASSTETARDSPACPPRTVQRSTCRHLSWDPVPNTENLQPQDHQHHGLAGGSPSRPTPTSYTPLGKLLEPGDGPYTWSVQAEDFQGRVTTAAVRTFQVSGMLLPRQPARH